MLVLHDADNLNLKNDLTAKTNPETDTWLVADLWAKNRLQTELMKTHKVLPEDAVLRVSELWRKLLGRGFVDIEVASAQFMATAIGEWLKKHDVAWARHPGTPRILMQYIGEFLPILARPEQIARTVEWLRENPEAMMRWGNWFVLAHQAWQHFCGQKILSATWVSAYLSGQDWGAELWHGERLIVDAGSNLTGVEVDLFQRLAGEREIQVFAPSADWCAAFQGTLWPYDLLAGRAFTKKPLDVKARDNVHCVRFTTRIAEVKAATAQVRRWLDAGVAPQDVGVLAADIESYWPALAAYFKQEGLPVEKDVVVAASSWPAVARWLSRLHVESHDVESGHLEMSVFHHQRPPPIAFDRFQQLFSRIYDERDLTRDRKVDDFFDLEVTGTDLMNRDRFFAWALRYWQDEPTAIERVAAEFLQECPASVVLELRSWIGYMSALIAKIEIKVGEGVIGGIFCGNLEAAQAAGLKNVVILGMSESELRPQVDLNLAHSDILSIAQDLGVTLNSPDRDENEYLAARVTLSTPRDVQLYFAATDFSGQPQAPALFWLRQALVTPSILNVEAYTAPGPTRWDELQTKKFADSEMAQAMRFDLGLEPLPPITPAKAPVYSASQIEKYLKCPFIFAAEKLFHLSDLPDIDLDVDSLTNGQLLHGVVEKILEPPLNFNRSEAEMIELVDRVRWSLHIPLADERLWPAKLRQLARAALGFQTFEREWRAQFAHTETVAREADVQGRLRLQGDREIAVRGRIDRVDAYQDDAGQTLYVVLDYKSSASGLVNHGSWLKNDDLQLAFYSLALQEGLVDLPRGTVIGAFYFVLSKLNREKGVRVKEAAGPLFAENTRNRTGVSAEEFQSLLELVREKIAVTVARIESGEMAPAPKDLKECDKCKWSTLCRAPHLN